MRIKSGWVLGLLVAVSVAGAAWGATEDAVRAAGSGEPTARVAEAEGEKKSELIDLKSPEFLKDSIATIAIFAGLVLVLRGMAWKPILQGLKSREMAIREGIEAAAKARADADRTTRELNAKIEEAQRLGAAALQQAKSDALKLAEGIRAQAESEAAALKDRALRDIDGAKQQALAEINGRAAEIGTAVARKILQREVNMGDQGRLVEETLAQLAKKN